MVQRPLCVRDRTLEPKKLDEYNFENQPNVILISVAVTNSCKISDCSKFAFDGRPSSVEKTISPPDKGEIFDIFESHNGSLSY